LSGYDLGTAFKLARVPIRAINGDLWLTQIEANRKLAPDFEAVIMRGAGHYPMLERPDEFNEILNGVVTRLAGLSAAGIGSRGAAGPVLSERRTPWRVEGPRTRHAHEPQTVSQGHGAVAGSLAFPRFARAAIPRRAPGRRRSGRPHSGRWSAASSCSTRVDLPELRRPRLLPDASADQPVGVDAQRGTGAERRPRQRAVVGGQGGVSRASWALSCRKEDLALVGCATEGINIIVNGLRSSAR